MKTKEKNIIICLLALIIVFVFSLVLFLVRGGSMNGVFVTKEWYNKFIPLLIAGICSVIVVLLANKNKSKSQA
ncbi:MAG: hypothetical protein ACOX4D_04685 [Bacteroidales bacterium]